MSKNKNLLKLVTLYLIYFIYTYVAGIMVKQFSFISEPLMMLIVDCLFMIFMIFVFKNKLKSDLQKLKKEYTFKKILSIIAFGVLSIFILNIAMGAITDLFLPGFELDQNTKAIQELASISMIYTIFKTMLFGIIAEELLFRESLNECVDNNTLFIILSAVIYTGMNFIFTTNQGSNLIVQLLIYFIPALLFSFIYVKNKRNILFIMMIKFVYNIIPLIILITSAV